MANDLWLPKGYKLPDGSSLQSLLYSGDDWQIFDTSGQNHVLLASDELVKKWIQAHLLDASVFTAIMFGTALFQALIIHKQSALYPVQNVLKLRGESFRSKVETLTFAVALNQSRAMVQDASFHDAIFVAQHRRLLPTWTLSVAVDDEVVLGTYLTGGVHVSTDSFRRLANLAGWMPLEDVVEVVRTAGFSVPANLPFLTKGNLQTKPESETSQTQLGNTQSKVFQLPGRPTLEKFFNEHVIDIVLNAERYQMMGIEFPSAIVLHGPPGCGKTFAVDRLVEFLDWPSYSVDSNSVGSPFIHQTAKKISEIFDAAIDAAPAVVVIDEMESFLADRQSRRSTGHHHVEEVAEFLRRIPEAVQKKVLIVAMTNLIELIDQAILRRGRFDHVIEVGMPSREEVESLFDFLLSKLPKVQGINLDPILDMLAGKPLSDSAFVVREAARLAAKARKSEIDQESLFVALDSLPKEKEVKQNRIGFV